MNETTTIHHRRKPTLPQCGTPFGIAREPRAFTLLEMLVATVLTLMLVAAMAQAFAVVGNGVSTSRAGLEMAGQLRAVSLRLQDDLSGVTVPTLPWPDPSASLGYFEYIDGADHDGVRFPWNTDFGDADDVLMFTARNDREPFLGSRSNGSGGVTTIESSLAEIVWFAALTDLNGNGTLEPDQFEDYTLYRRALLIRPDLGVVATLPNSGTYNITSQPDLQQLYDDLRTFFSQNDVSVRIVTQLSGVSGNDLRVSLVANTLGDLTKRENRFAHRRVVAESTTTPETFQYFGANFPHRVDRDFTSATSLPSIRKPFRPALPPLPPFPPFPPFPQLPQPSNPNPANFDPYFEPGAIKTGDYQGEDVVLAHLLAFDIRAYDPLAMVAAHTGEDGILGSSDDEPVIPGDPGFGSTLRLNNQIGEGAFVDLNYAGKHGYDMLRIPGSTPPVYFWSHFSGGIATYDTWSFHYEYDGIDQDGDGVVDEGTDGLDTNGTNGVDDVGERETSPPYPFPLRAVQARIRIVDHSSRQVRQATVESSFVPN